MVIAIDDEQEISMMVERQASRIVELANIFAWLLGADRELDSSISAKRIVFHLKLSPTRDTREMRHQASKQATKQKQESESLPGIESTSCLALAISLVLLPLPRTPPAVARSHLDAQTMTEPAAVGDAGTTTTTTTTTRGHEHVVLLSPSQSPSPSPPPACPVCHKALAAFSLLDRQSHINACLDGSSSLLTIVLDDDKSVVVAAEDDDDFVPDAPKQPCACPVCGRDISRYNAVRRTQHTNRCVESAPKEQQRALAELLSSDSSSSSQQRRVSAKTVAAPVAAAAPSATTATTTTPSTTTTDPLGLAAANWRCTYCGKSFPNVHLRTRFRHLQTCGKKQAQAAAAVATSAASAAPNSAEQVALLEALLAPPDSTAANAAKLSKTKKPAASATTSASRKRSRSANAPQASLATVSEAAAVPTTAAMLPTTARAAKAVARSSKFFAAAAPASSKSSASALSAANADFMNVISKAQYSSKRRLRTPSSPSDLGDMASSLVAEDHQARLQLASTALGGGGDDDNDEATLSHELELDTPPSNGNSGGKQTADLLSTMFSDDEPERHRASGDSLIDEQDDIPSTPRFAESPLAMRARRQRAATAAPTTAAAATAAPSMPSPDTTIATGTATSTTSLWQLAAAPLPGTTIGSDSPALVEQAVQRFIRSSKAAASKKKRKPQPQTQPQPTPTDRRDDMDMERPTLAQEGSSATAATTPTPTPTAPDIHSQPMDTQPTPTEVVCERAEPPPTAVTTTSTPHDSSASNPPAARLLRYQSDCEQARRRFVEQYEQLYTAYLAEIGRLTLLKDKDLSTTTTNIGGGSMAAPTGSLAAAVPTSGEAALEMLLSRDTTATATSVTTTSPPVAYSPPLDTPAAAVRTPQQQPPPFLVYTSPYPNGGNLVSYSPFFGSPFVTPVPLGMPCTPSTPISSYSAHSNAAAVEPHQRSGSRRRSRLSPSLKRTTERFCTPPQSQQHGSSSTDRPSPDSRRFTPSKRRRFGTADPDSELRKRRRISRTLYWNEPAGSLATTAPSSSLATLVHGSDSDSDDATTTAPAHSFDRSTSVATASRAKRAPISLQLASSNNNSSSSSSSSSGDEFAYDGVLQHFSPPPRVMPRETHAAHQRDGATTVRFAPDEATLAGTATMTTTEMAAALAAGGDSFGCTDTDLVTDVTDCDRPDYGKMSTEDLRAEVSKIGLKPASRQDMIQRLSHVWQATHLRASSDALREAALLQSQPLPGSSSSSSSKKPAAAVSFESALDQSLVHSVSEFVKSNQQLYESILLYKVRSLAFTRESEDAFLTSHHTARGPAQDAGHAQGPRHQVQPQVLGLVSREPGHRLCSSFAPRPLWRRRWRCRRVVCILSAGQRRCGCERINIACLRWCESACLARERERERER